ncbi:MAG: hypothetical protein ACFFD2_04250 [Promethearchaeota archaeon]
MKSHIKYEVKSIPNITLSIPDEIYKIMKKYKEIRWSEIARQAIEKFSKKLELLEKIDYEEIIELFNTLLQNSELTEENVLKINKQIKKNVFKRIIAKRQ